MNTQSTLASSLSTSLKRPQEEDPNSPVASKRAREERKYAGIINSRTTKLKAPRSPKHRYALLIGASGRDIQITKTPASRSQVNEGILFDALVKVGAVSEQNASNTAKFVSAVWLDAGMHAAGNVVSLNLVADAPSLLARVNEELPPEIRLWCILRVPKRFNARRDCDSRKYTYMFPSYLMIYPEPGSSLHQKLQQEGTQSANDPFWTKNGIEMSTEDELRSKRRYRMPQEILEWLRVMASRLEGAHDYHNFTLERVYCNQNHERRVFSVQIEDPIVYGDTEWVKVLFHGRSFMIYQRKMVSILVLACRTGSPPEIITELYGPRRLFIPKMPAVGLLLEYPTFDTPPTQTIDYRLTSRFIRDGIEQFKQDFIYSRIQEAEYEGVFDMWTRSIDAYAGNDLLYLNLKGFIPAVAVNANDEHSMKSDSERGVNAIILAARSVDKNMKIADEKVEEQNEAATLHRAQLGKLDG